MTFNDIQTRQWHRSDVFIVNFKTYFTSFSIVFVVDFEQVNVS